MITFCFGVSSNFSQQKSPTAEILRIYFLGTIVWRKYLPKISAVGLFSCDKFEETPKQKVIDLSKFKKNYFMTSEISDKSDLAVKNTLNAYSLGKISLNNYVAPKITQTRLIFFSRNTLIEGFSKSNLPLTHI